MLAGMIYVCAGMYRSGSTWLYNAVRLILAEAGVADLAAGWAGEKERIVAQRNSLIKIHEFDKALASTKNIVFTSHRDLRDVAASLIRKFQSSSPIELLRETVDAYTQWSRVASYDLRYENLLTDKAGELRKLARALRLPDKTLSVLPYEAVIVKIEREKFLEGRANAQRFDPVNLLHEGHVTDGRHGSWTDTLSDETVRAIEKEFRPWLVARAYLS